ncbi:MAG TPA: haloacid dehalogenase type II [Streptosporangiaceae bacterium]
MAGRMVNCVAFDVNETLFSLDRLGPAFAGAGLDPAQVPLWFALLLRDGFALTAMGGYAPFAELAADALRSLYPAGVDDAAVAGVLAGFRELDPHPDVLPALQALGNAGVPAVTLTNGGVELVRLLVKRAGLSGHVQRCLSVDAVRRFKPAPEPYRYAAAQLGVEAARMALVAAHPWDCAGARAAGLRSGWVNRRGQRWPGVFAPPDVTGSDLPTVVTGLLDLE